jgi:DNA ligase-4
VASVQKLGTQDIVRPAWLFDCLQQNETDGQKSEMARERKYLLPLEPG